MDITAASLRHGAAQAEKSGGKKRRKKNAEKSIFL